LSSFNLFKGTVNTDDTVFKSHISKPKNKMVEPRVTVVQSMSWPAGFLLAVVIAAALIIYFALSRRFPRRVNLENTHVLVTGGSSGIGLACAVECAKRGANVTLLARDVKKLATARDVVRASIADVDGRFVNVVSCDISKDFIAVQNAFVQAESLMGRPVDILVNCAGSGPACAFDKVDVGEFERLMRLNYLTTVFATRAVMPGMKARGRGRILFTSSQAGQLGLYGYTAYSASKFALRGFAEALQMEVKPFNIFLTLAFPPDTETPGFLEESKSLPDETKEISATSGLFEVGFVASRMIDALVDGSFFCFIGLDGFLLGNLTAGMAPVTSALEAIIQVATMSLFRLIGIFYIVSFDGICEKWKKLKENKKEQ